MIDINTVDIPTLLKGFNVILDRENTGWYKFHEIAITPKDKDLILKSIELRKAFNDVREVGDIAKYRRKDAQTEKEIDIKALTGEYMFSKFMLNVCKNKPLKEYEVIVPPVAEMILNKSKQDVVINHYQDKQRTQLLDFITFDIKSQFETNSFNYVSVNIDSFDRMKQQSKFFILVLIDGKQDDFNTNNKVTFYLVKNDWYEQKSLAVTKPYNPTQKRFSPYRKLNISAFLSSGSHFGK